MVIILLGSKSYQVKIYESEFLKLLKRIKIEYELQVISSDRNPEELRVYCLNNKDRITLVIAIAGGVPNLPIVVKSWLPEVPVICVPIENNPDFALASLTTPNNIPVIVAGYGESGLQKAAYLAKEILIARNSSK